MVRQLASADGPGPGCEALADGLLQEPVAAVSSLAFVVAGLVIAVRGRGRGRGTVAYPALVAAVGLGSAVQHGPDPAGADLIHDLPLLATLAFVGADAVADLSGRARSWWWWVAPTVALLPLIVAAPRAGDVAQVGVAAVAVLLTLVRAQRAPALRRPVGWALVLLAVGGIVGTLSRAGGPLCDPASLWQGHAVWHVLAAVALVVLSPVVGADAGRWRIRPGDR